MLENCKPEELIKYSKGSYDKEKFINEVIERWELTPKQLRMTYLAADLAITASGVFSITYENFLKMFERRFKMGISLSSVRRFFALLEELEVLTINAAQRKNRKQSANIYIIETIEIEQESHETTEDISIAQMMEHLDEQLDGYLDEQRNEHLEGQHNIVFNKDLNLDLNRDINTDINKHLLTKNLVNKDTDVQNEQLKNSNRLNLYFDWLNES